MQGGQWWVRTGGDAGKLPEGNGGSLDSTTSMMGRSDGKERVDLSGLRQ